MKTGKTGRGFEMITHPMYPGGSDGRILLQSSVIGDYPDSLENPGSSYLWIGNNFHLNREEVRSLVLLLNSWLETGNFSEETCQ